MELTKNSFWRAPSRKSAKGEIKKIGCLYLTYDKDTIIHTQTVGNAICMCPTWALKKVYEHWLCFFWQELRFWWKSITSQTPYQYLDLSAQTPQTWYMFAQWYLDQISNLLHDSCASWTAGPDTLVNPSINMSSKHWACWVAKASSATGKTWPKPAGQRWHHILGSVQSQNAAMYRQEETDQDHIIVYCHIVA